MSGLVTLESSRRRFELADDASATFTDLVSGRMWRMGPVVAQEDNPIDVGHVWLRTERSQCEQYPGRFRLRREGEVVRATVLGDGGSEQGSFTFGLRLDGDELVFTLLAVGEELPSLIFPPGFESASLVLPQGVGLWLRTPVAQRRILRFYSGLNMRWFGGLAEGDDAGWMAIFSDHHADGGGSVTQRVASPVHLRSLDTWAEATFPREVRYRLTSGGYVGMAGEFRSFAIAAGIHRTLLEKREENPKLGHLIGGRELNCYLADSTSPEREQDALAVVSGVGREPELKVHVPLAQVRRVAREARALGMQRGIVMLRGWMNGGYDERHPDVWPPEPGLGTVEDFREVVGGDLGFPGGLHDNYADIYRQSPSFPEGVLQTREGRLKRGGFWAGGQAYVLDPRAGLAYARRNWEHIQALNPLKIYSDTITATYLEESFHPARPLRRAEDEAAKQEVLRFFRAQGVVVASEEGADFAGALLDTADTQHRRHRSSDGITIPLWPLVFHDAMLCGRHNTTVSATDSAAPWTVSTLLWGYYPMWWVTSGPDWAGGFAESLYVDQFHARVAMEPMTGHRFLDAERWVEQTEFGSGESVVANFGPERVQVEGYELAPGSATVVG